MQRELLFLLSCKKATILAFFAVMLMVSWSSGDVFGQFQITYPKQAKSLSTCQGADSLFVRIDVTQAGNNGNVTVNLPPGIVYIAGSVVKTGGTIASITELNISNLNQPVFSIGTVSPGQFITFILKREDPECVARQFVINGGVMKDSIRVNSSAGTVTEYNPNTNSYNLRYASLALSGQGPIGGAVGSTVMRNVMITNGGFGPLSQYTFKITEDITGLNTTKLETPGGTLISPLSTTVSGNTRTITYTITSALIAQFGDGDNLMENGEVVTLKRTYQIIGCTLPSNYHVSWGCGGDQCQTLSIPQQTNTGNGVPRIRLNKTTAIQKTNMCKEVIYEYEMKNTGSESAPGAGTAYDIDFLAGMNYSGSSSLIHNAPISTILDVTVGGVNITSCTNCPGSIGVRGDLSLLTSAQGGLIDGNGDGKFDDLPVGASFTVRIRMQWDCQSTCGINHSSGEMKVSTDYKNQCNVTVSRSVQTTTPNESLYKLSDLGIEGPADIHNGEQFTLSVCQTYTETLPNGSFFDCPTNDLILQIQVPNGFTPVLSTAKFNGVAALANFSGGLLEIHGNASGGSGLFTCYDIDFTLNCAQYVGPPNFVMTIKYVCDQACACMERWNCKTWTPNVHCPGPCATGGLTTQKTLVQRLTMGYTDNTATARVNPASVSVLEKKRALPCDTLMFSMYGIQQGGTSGGVTQTWNNGFLHLEYNQLSGANLLSPASGSVQFYDQSTGTYTNCILPAPTETISGGKHILEYNLTGCLGANTLSPGDSMNVFAKMTVLDNSALDKIPTQIPGISIYHYNLVSGNKVYCETYSAEVYPHTYKMVNRGSSGSFSVTGCSNFNVNHSINTGVTYDQYTMEYRPEGRLDSIVLDLGPTGTLDPTHPHTLQAANNGSGSTLVMLGAPTYSSGNKYTWVNPGTWPIGDERSDPFTYRADFFALPSCASTNGPARTSYYFDDNYYSFPVECKTPSVLTLSGNVTISLPNVTITNMSGTVPAAHPTKWNVRIQNTSGTGANYVWVAFPTGSGVLTASGLKDLNTNTVIPLVSYSGGVWAQLQTNLAGGGIIDLEVSADLASCVADSLQVVMGWDCREYPTDPASTTCGKSLYLKETTMPSEVQLVLVQEQTNPVPTCSPSHYELIINSAQAAGLTDIQFALHTVNGITVSSPVEFEYPEGSNNWQALANLGDSENMLFDVMTHTQIPPEGIPGTFDNLSLPPRQIRVRFDAQLMCEFIPGSSFNFNIYANNLCGDPATGNGIKVTTQDIKVQGFTFPYQEILTTSSSQSTVNCESEATVSLHHLIYGVGSSISGDYVEVVFPPGLKYSGTLNCTANCPTVLSYVDNVDGTSTLILTKPAGMSAGSIMDYSIGVLAKSAPVCNITNNNIIITSYAVVDGFYCGATQCADINFPSVKDTVNISPVLSSLSLNVAQIKTCERPNGTIKVKGSATLLQNDLGPTQSVSIQVLCLDASGNPIGAPAATQTFNGPMTANTVFNFDMLATGCSASNNIKIIGVGTCVCDTSETTMPVGNSTFDTVSVVTDCIDGQNEYIMTVTVSGGTAPYTLTSAGLTGTWNGTIWTSNPIPGGNSYAFSVTDTDSCNVVNVTGDGPVCCTLVVTCPSDTTVDCTSSTDVASMGSPIVISSCGTTSTTHTDVTSSQTNDYNYVITRTFTIVDEANDTVTCVQIIMVQDTTKPVFVEDLPQDTTVNCDAIPEAVVLTATDNCSPAANVTVVYNEVRTNGNCANNYTLTRTWTATDESGNETVYTQIVTVQDTTKPVFVEDLPQDTTVNCDAVPDAVVMTATDNCSGPSDITIDYTEVRTDGDCPYNYTLTRTWVATDECGNETTHVQIVTVQDTTKPVFVEDLPQDILVDCDAVPEPVILTATDNCSLTSLVTIDFTEVRTDGDCPYNYTSPT
ncbi:MAG: hypothetical protein E6Q89_04835, partial [Bacteroidia bacterium]